MIKEGSSGFPLFIWFLYALKAIARCRKTNRAVVFC